MRPALLQREVRDWRGETAITHCAHARAQGAMRRAVVFNRISAACFHTTAGTFSRMTPRNRRGRTCRPCGRSTGRTDSTCSQSVRA